MEKRGKKSLVLDGILVLFAFVIFIVFSGYATASAVTVTMSEINSTLASVSISNAVNLYSYEVNFDSSGTASVDDTKDFYGYLGAGTSKGGNLRSGVYSVYESQLDSSRPGVNGSAPIFNVSHSSTLSLRYALFIYNDSTEEYVYYNASAVPAISGLAPSGGGGVSKPKVLGNVSIDTKEINLDMIVNSNKERIIRVTNNGNAEESIKISQSNLDDMVIFKEIVFRLAPKESREMRITFLAREKPGIYTGKIYVAGHEILVSMNVRTKELLFDAMIAVPDNQKSIILGSKLDAQITLIPMGDNETRIDVTLNYLVKDYDGKTYMSESETILVDSQKSFRKQFQTGSLPVGNYIVGLEVVYPNGVAASSSHFEVIRSKPVNLIIAMIILSAFIIAFIILIAYFVIRYERRKKHLLGRFNRSRR